MALVALAGLLILPGCAPSAEPGCPPEGSHLVIATTDFEVGALATVDEGGCIYDRWSSTGGDPLIREVAGALFSVERAGSDRVREFSPGRYDTPLRELSIGQDINIHDVIAVGEERWYALYEQSRVVRTDTEGRPLGEIDLSPHADPDGIPEIDRLILRGETVYASLQRLDRAQGWLPHEGLVVALSPDGTIGAPVAVGPNPKLHPDPSSETSLLALTGRWYDLDGALVRYHTDTDIVETLLTEQDLGVDLGALAGIDHHIVLLGVDPQERSHLFCLDLQTLTLQDGPTTDAWLVDAVASPQAVYVAVRTGWSEAISRELWRIDPQTCSIDVEVDSLSLDPYAMAWIP